MDNDATLHFCLTAFMEIVEVNYYFAVTLMTVSNNLHGTAGKNEPHLTEALPVCGSVKTRLDPIQAPYKYQGDNNLIRIKLNSEGDD